MYRALFEGSAWAQGWNRNSVHNAAKWQKSDRNRIRMIAPPSINYIPVAAVLHGFTNLVGQDGILRPIGNRPSRTLYFTPTRPINNRSAGFHPAPQGQSPHTAAGIPKSFAFKG